MKATLFLAIFFLATSGYPQIPPQTCGCEDKPLPEVIATVNGTKLMREDFSAETRSRVKELQQKVIDARGGELDLQINSRLLDAEAKKRGVSSAKLLEVEIVSKVTEPTEAEAQAFYDQNRAQIPAEFKAVKGDIIGYLRDQRRQELAKALATRLRAVAQVKLLAPVTPPLIAADRARVFATVEGRNITSGDIEDSLRPLIYSVQEQIYKLRKDELDMKINDALLSQEAQKRGVTAVDLITKEVKAKLPVITEEAAQKFFNDNKERIRGDFAQIKTQIIEYLLQREEISLSRSFAEQLRRSAAVQTFLTAPEQPVYNIATDDQPTKGNLKAAVTLVEFTDYQCPNCSTQHPILERLINEYGDRVRFVVRDFPLSQHENAAKAAEAAEAAREQGKYWEFVALLFGRQSALQEEKLKQYATELGLDRVKFDAALATGKFGEKVQRDFVDGQKVGVNGTPALFLNGRRVLDPSYDGLKASIEDALKKSR